MRRARAWLSAIGRYWLVLAVATVSATLGSLLATWDRISTLEYEIEQQLQVQYAPAKPSSQVVIVKITPDDLPMTPDGPVSAMPRRTQAELLNLLKKVGARVLVFDLIFGKSQPADDPILREAILNSAPLCVAICQRPDAKYNEDARTGFTYQFRPPPFLPKTLPRNVELGQSVAVDTGSLAGSIALIAKDEDTGEYVQHIALIAFRQLHNIPKESVTPDWDDSRVIVDTNAFQVGPDGDFTIDWQSEKSEPPELTYTEALKALRSGDPKHRFEGKIVIVGNVIGDPVAHTVQGDKLGLQMVAGVENTIERTDQKKPHKLDWNDDVALGAVLALLMSFAMSFKSRVAAFLLGATAIAAACLVPIIFMKFGLGVISTTLPFAASLVALILGVTARSMIPNLYPMPRLGATEATVLIVDIKDSTPTVESLGPTRGGALLSQGVAMAKRIVTSEQGEVIRETGDGLVAIFRATVGFDHASAAIRAALRVVGESKENADIVFCAGVESGPLQQQHGRLQGLPFHLASRLQSQCAAEGQNLLIGPTAAALARAEFHCECVGERQLKGINHSVAVFKVMQQ